MSLKLISSTLVFAAALICVSATASSRDDKALKDSDSERPQLKADGSYRVPDFSMKVMRNMISMSAKDGAIKYADRLMNTTQWIMQSGTNAASATQNATMDGASLVYNNTMLRAGMLDETGKLLANMTGSTIIITLTATETPNGTCQLDITATLAELGLVVSLEDFGLVGKLVSNIIGVLQTIANLLLKELLPVLQALLTLLVGNALNVVDVNKVCLDLLNANVERLPGIDTLTS